MASNQAAMSAEIKNTIEEQQVSHSPSGAGQGNAQILSPLMLACQAGKLAAVNKLLGEGAEISEKTPERITAFYIACKNGHAGIVQALLNHQRNETKCVNEMLNVSCDDKNLFEIEKDKDKEVTPLVAACHNGHASVVSLLLKAGADVTKTDADGATALYAACQNGRISTMEVLLNYKQPSLKLCIQLLCGKDINEDIRKLLQEYIKGTAIPLHNGVNQFLGLVNPNPTKAQDQLFEKKVDHEKQVIPPSPTKKPLWLLEKATSDGRNKHIPKSNFFLDFSPDSGRAIIEIREIAEARLAYNEAWADALKNKTLSFKDWISAFLVTNLLNKKQLATLESMTYQDCKDGFDVDINLYRDILITIKSGMPDLFERLHMCVFVYDMSQTKTKLHNPDELETKYTKAIGRRVTPFLSKEFRVFFDRMQKTENLLFELTHYIPIGLATINSGDLQKTNDALDKMKTQIDTDFDFSEYYKKSLDDLYERLEEADRLDKNCREMAENDFFAFVISSGCCIEFGDKRITFGTNSSGVKNLKNIGYSQFFTLKNSTGELLKFSFMSENFSISSNKDVWLRPLWKTIKDNFFRIYNLYNDTLIMTIHLSNVLKLKTLKSSVAPKHTSLDKDNANVANVVEETTKSINICLEYSTELDDSTIKYKEQRQQALQAWQDEIKKKREQQLSREQLIKKSIQADIRASKEEAEDMTVEHAQQILHLYQDLDKNDRVLFQSLFEVDSACKPTNVRFANIEKLIKKCGGSLASSNGSHFTIQLPNTYAIWEPENRASTLSFTGIPTITGGSYKPHGPDEWTYAAHFFCRRAFERAGITPQRSAEARNIVGREPFQFNVKQ